MSNSRNLAKLVGADIFSVDANNNVGVASTTPNAKLDVVGVVSATLLYGDGSNLTNLNVGAGTSINDENQTVRLIGNSSGAVATGVMTANTYFGDASLLTNIDSAANVSNDDTTDDTFYILLAENTSGILTTAYISTTKLTFNPSSGTLGANDLDLPPLPIILNPLDGATNVGFTTNIVITFDIPVQKGSGNITLRKGSAVGTAFSTIPVSSNQVTVSNGEVTIDPALDLPTNNDLYVVVDQGAFTSLSHDTGNALFNTYNFNTADLVPTSFDPVDGDINVGISSTINITFNAPIAKGTGNITLRLGSASGTVRQTIDVTTGAVAVSGSTATITPPSALTQGDNLYVVVDSGAFTNSYGDSGSATALINTYNFSVQSLGTAGGGGYYICQAGGYQWIVAPSSTQVSRNWYDRLDAVTTANANAGCGDWFVPTCDELANPGYACRNNWDSYTAGWYWSNSDSGETSAWLYNFDPNNFQRIGNATKSFGYNVRSFRKVTY